MQAEIKPQTYIKVLEARLSQVTSELLATQALLHETREEVHALKNPATPPVSGPRLAESEE